MRPVSSQYLNYFLIGDLWCTGITFSTLRNTKARVKSAWARSRKKPACQHRNCFLHDLYRVARNGCFQSFTCRISSIGQTSTTPSAIAWVSNLYGFLPLVRYAPQLELVCGLAYGLAREYSGQSRHGRVVRKDVVIGPVKHSTLANILALYEHFESTRSDAWLQSVQHKTR